jgi:FkbM family methyltransferase
MNMPFFSRAVSFLKNRYMPRGARPSFSQSGEDLLIADIAHRLGIKQLTYIDIGCHHPIFSNNTYRLYRNGGRGVLIEPNEALCKVIRAKRSRDICVCGGVGPADTTARFYSFKGCSTRSSFSKTQAQEWQQQSGETPTEHDVPLFSLDAVIATHCKDKRVDLISLDAEGYDFQILSSFAWSVRPAIWCIETGTGELTANGELVRSKEIYDLMQTRGYTVYGETKANTLFVDTARLRS